MIKYNCGLLLGKIGHSINTHLKKKYHCMAGLQFEWFGLSSSSTYFIVWSHPMQLNQRPTVQISFPLQWEVSGSLFSDGSTETWDVFFGIVDSRSPKTILDLAPLVLGPDSGRSRKLTFKDMRRLNQDRILRQRSMRSKRDEPDSGVVAGEDICYGRLVQLKVYSANAHHT